MNLPTTRAPVRPDYGLDAPFVVRNLALGGFAASGLGLLAYFTLRESHPDLAARLLNGGIWPGLSWLASSGVMIHGSQRGKLRVRDRLLDGLRLRGDEQVLDVGCGHGLLLIGAAKRLNTGRAVGIDIWQAKDQADNRAEATRRNAEIEGVSQRVEICEADARKMPFPDATFDVVLSSWALHNIPTKVGREQAVREIGRVLRPGGKVALLDIWYTRNYLKILRNGGVQDGARSLASLCFLWPTFLVAGCKI
ncbi:hypothetical protein AYO40_04765 [Planctomycetaceae bacterium SCGC AG-212-D15]|nr:hypothetical protein AYO40_04765 [Planctomycetaceae bacterium SCGC AG-212-D15]